VANGIVYVGSGDGGVYAINATTGQIVWKTVTGGAVNSSPEVANGVVYVGSSDGGMYAINATTGQIVWKLATGGAVDSPPRW
jgi:outer membrane protein assembly factor BamB